MIVKKIPIIIVLILTVLILADFCFAQRDLEVPLPQMGGESAITKTPVLPDYVKYVFNFGIGIAGLIAFLMIVYGGFRYLTSAGNPSAMSDANSQIFAGLIGLIVILGSWLLLTTINPQLIVINPQLKESELVVGEMPGVYLCRDAAGTDCQVFNSSKTDIGDLRGEVQYVKFSNSGDIEYGAVLHQDKDYQGSCAICLGDGCNDGYNNISDVSGVSSVQVFIQSDSSLGEGVSLYEKEEYNEDCQPGQCERSPSTGGYKNTKIPDLNKRGKSIKIEENGKYLAALFEDTNYNKKCEIFTRSDPGLAENPIGVCGLGSNMGCFMSIFVLPIK